MFWVMGLFVTYQLDEFIVAFPPAIVFHTRVVPTADGPQPAGNAGWWTVIAARNPTMEKVVGMVNDLVSPNQLRHADPWGKLIGAVTTQRQLRHRCYLEKPGLDP